MVFTTQVPVFFGLAGKKYKILAQYLQNDASYAKQHKDMGSKRRR